MDLPEENIFGSNIQIEAKALMWSRHETFNRFKQWKFLSLIFRHTLKHAEVKVTFSCTLISVFLNFRCALVILKDNVIIDNKALAFQKTLDTYYLENLFDSIAIVTQILIDYGRKIFSVDYKTKTM